MYIVHVHLQFLVVLSKSIKSNRIFTESLSHRAQPPAPAWAAKNLQLFIYKNRCPSEGWAPTLVACGSPPIAIAYVCLCARQGRKQRLDIEVHTHTVWACLPNVTQQQQPRKRFHWAPHLCEMVYGVSRIHSSKLILFRNDSIVPPSYPPSCELFRAKWQIAAKITTLDLWWRKEGVATIGCFVAVPLPPRNRISLSTHTWTHTLIHVCPSAVYAYIYRYIF